MSWTLVTVATLVTVLARLSPVLLATLSAFPSLKSFVMPWAFVTLVMVLARLSPVMLATLSSLLF